MTDGRLDDARLGDLKHYAEASDPSLSWPIKVGDLLRLLSEVQASRALLRRIEWSARVGQDSDAACPECEEWATFGEHAKDCELAVLIGKAP